MSGYKYIKMADNFEVSEELIEKTRKAVMKKNGKRKLSSTKRMKVSFLLSVVLVFIAVVIFNITNTGALKNADKQVIQEVYKSDAFKVKVYAAKNSATSSVNDAIELNVNEKIEMKVTSNALSHGGGPKSSSFSLPIICEGDDIKELKYEFNDSKTEFQKMFIYPEGVVKPELMQGDVDHNSTEFKTYYEDIHKYMKENNLSANTEANLTTKVYKTLQNLGAPYTMPFKDQDNTEMYFKVTSDSINSSEEFYVKIGAAIEQQVLTITATYNDNSVQVRHFKFEVASRTGNICRSLYIIAID